MDKSRGLWEDSSEALDLDNVRSTLIRLEDSIIFSLIERAQFRRNDAIYQPDAIPVPGFDRTSGVRYSLLEYILREHESLFGKLRKYTSPDEHAFFEDSLPHLVLPPLTYPKVLSQNADKINVNDTILRIYLQEIVPSITERGDDCNYGSAACYDVMCLQAISKRIHYGKFVAEAKFRANRETYAPLIEKQDAEGLMALLTFPAVEERVVKRVRNKAATYGQDIQDELVEGIIQQEVKYKVEPEEVAQLYSQWIMPITKEVQVMYLLRRLEDEPPSESRNDSS